MTNDRPRERRSGRTLGLWFAVGMAIGAGLGMAMDNIAVGVAIGLALLGVAVGVSERRAG